MNAKKSPLIKMKSYSLRYFFAWIFFVLALWDLYHLMFEFKNMWFEALLVVPASLFGYVLMSFISSIIVDDWRFFFSAAFIGILALIENALGNPLLHPIMLRGEVEITKDGYMAIETPAGKYARWHYEPRIKTDEEINKEFDKCINCPKIHMEYKPVSMGVKFKVDGMSGYDIWNGNSYELYSGDKKFSPFETEGTRPTKVVCQTIPDAIGDIFLGQERWLGNKKYLRPDCFRPR